MIELPESIVLAHKGSHLFKGLKITNVTANKTSHSFCWMNKEPSFLAHELVGKKISEVVASSHYLRFIFDDETELATGEDVIFSYKSKEKESEKHQLLLLFDNDMILEFKIKLYGFILFGKSSELKTSWPYYQKALDAVDPLSPKFTYEYFLEATGLNQTSGSVKQALSTNQHIPGLGNGILQDVLFNAHLQPKHKVSSLTDDEKHQLYMSFLSTLKIMITQGGRNNVSHFENDFGHYDVLMQSNRDRCPVCSATLVKEAYLGGKVIYCPQCQK